MSKWELMSKEEIIQDLINICFECCLFITDTRNYNRKERKQLAHCDDETKAAWVARQLKLCGYNTKPMGMSWGVLSKEDFE